MKPEVIVDESIIHLAPVLLGGGLRLFETLAPDPLKLEPTAVIGSYSVTRWNCRVSR